MNHKIQKKSSPDKKRKQQMRDRRKQEMKSIFSGAKQLYIRKKHYLCPDF